MPKLLKIGIAGCGAIGSTLAKAIVTDFSKQAELVGLYDSDAGKSSQLSAKLNKVNLCISNLDDLISRADLIVEATRLESAFEIARKTISLSKDVMVMSVGGILSYYKELSFLANKKNARIFIPSGAICGIDGLKAAGYARIKKVILTTKKPPKAFLGTAYISKKKIKLDKIKKDTLLFEGNAVAAIKAFPQNINVAATLSIAGIGAKKTLVRIMASPKIRRNIHEIEIEADSGKIFSRTENVIHPDNPKTSYLAVLSANAILKQILQPVKVGT